MTYPQQHHHQADAREDNGRVGLDGPEHHARAQQQRGKHRKRHLREPRRSTSHMLLLLPSTSRRCTSPALPTLSQERMKHPMLCLPVWPGVTWVASSPICVPTSARIAGRRTLRLAMEMVKRRRWKVGRSQSHFTRFHRPCAPPPAPFTAPPCAHGPLWPPRNHVRMLGGGGGRQGPGHLRKLRGGVPPAPAGSRPRPPHRSACRRAAHLQQPVLTDLDRRSAAHAGSKAHARQQRPWGAGSGTLAPASLSRVAVAAAVVPTASAVRCEASAILAATDAVPASSLASPYAQPLARYDQVMRFGIKA